MHEDRAIVESIASIGELPPGLIFCEDLPGRISQWRVIHGPGRGTFFNLPHSEIMSALRQHGGPNGLLAHHFPASPPGTFVLDGNGGQYHVLTATPLPFYGALDGKTVGWHKGRFWTRFPLKTPCDPTGEHYNVVLRLEDDAIYLALCSGLAPRDQLFTRCKRQMVTYDLDLDAGRIPEIVARYKDDSSLRRRVIRCLLKELLPPVDCPVGFRLRGNKASFQTTEIALADFDQLTADAWALKRRPDTNRHTTFYTATDLGHLDEFDPEFIQKHLVQCGNASSDLRTLWTAILIGARPEGYGISPNAVFEYSRGNDTRSWMHPGNIWRTSQILSTPAAREIWFQEPTAHEELAALTRLTTFFATARLPEDLRGKCLAMLEG